MGLFKLHALTATSRSRVRFAGFSLSFFCSVFFKNITLFYCGSTWGFLGDSSDRTGLDGFLLGRLSCLIIGPIGFLASAQRCRKPHSRVLWGKEHTSCNSQPPTVLLQKWVAEGKPVFSTLSLLLLWLADVRHWRWIDGHRRERALLVAVSHRATGRCDDTPTGQCHVQGRGMKAQLSCLIHYRRLFLLDFSVSFFKDHENPILEMPNWVFLEFIWDGVILPLRSAWHLRSLFSDIHLLNFFLFPPNL